MNGINTDRAAGTSRGRGQDDDVTRSTTGSASGADGRGRPKELRDPKRTSVTLERDHVEFLDDTAARIKLGGGEKVSRGALLRAVLDALMQSDLDVASADSAADLADRLRNRLRNA
jgi:hypothetical protein